MKIQNKIMIQFNLIQDKQMGNLAQQNLAFKPIIGTNKWQILAYHPPIKDRVKCDIASLRNKTNGQCIDRYLLEFKSIDQEKLYKYYCSKRTNSPNLVQIISYQSFETNEMCRQTIKSYVYTEHIPLRLSQVRDLPFLQSIHIIDKALQGFSNLFKECGFFQIQQDLFCFNYTGKTKVWLNQNLSLNFPIKLMNKKAENLQQLMLIRILAIIQQNTKFTNDERKIMFSKYLKNSNIKVFCFQNLKLHFKIYCNKFNINIPSNCHSVIQLLKQLSITHKKKLSSDSHKKQTILKIKPYTPNPNRSAFEKISPINSIKSLHEVSLDQSTKINVIWQQEEYGIGFEMKNKIMKKGVPQPRIRKLGNDIFTKQGTALVGKFQFQQSRIYINDEYVKSSTVSYLSLSGSHIEVLNDNSQKSIIEKKYLQSTGAYSPKIKAVEAAKKCIYSTVQGSVEIDNQIAQDLLKYL